MLCDGDELVDVLRQGQGVLNVLPLAGVKDDIDAQLRPARPTTPADDAGRRAGRYDARARRRSTRVHRALGARMVPFGGWEMPLEYPAGTIAEHLACRQRRRRVRRLPPRHGAGRRRRRASTGCSETLTNDLGKIGPGRAQYTHLLDDADGSVLDDIIVWWHPATTAADVFDVMPNASNTDRVRDAVGGDETTARPGRARRAGAAGAATAWPRCSPRPPPSAASGSPTPTWNGDAVHRRRHRLHGRAGRRDRRAGRRRGRPVGGDRRRRRRAGRARRPRHAAAGGRPAAARPRARPGHHAAAGRAGLGGGVGQAGVPRPRGAARRARAPASPRHLVGIATEGRRPPRAGCAVLVDGEPVGEVTSGNFSPVLGHGIALAFVPPAVAEGTAVMVDVRGTALPGTVVPTPFVAER